MQCELLGGPQNAGVSSSISMTLTARVSRVRGTNRNLITAHADQPDKGGIQLFGKPLTVSGQPLAVKRGSTSVFFGQHDGDDTLGDRRIGLVGRVRRNALIIEIIDFEKDQMTIGFE